jgi:uncharacterized protein (TIGR00251 family)
MISYTAKDNCITFSVRVQPRASHSKIVGEVDRSLKVKVAAPPVDGEANGELIRFLAKYFEVSRRDVEIISGETAKNKIIRIYGITRELFEAQLPM